MDKTRLTTTITRPLRAQLEEAMEASGRRLTDEVEARLRDSLNSRNTDGLLLLKVDDGLMAWLRAIDRIKFFGITFEETVIYLIRTAMLEMTDRGKHSGPSVWYQEIVDNLPEPFRSANQDSPLYRRMVKYGRGE